MKYLALFALLSWPVLATSQLLVANGDFEENNICTEYNSACAPEAWFRIPPTDLTITYYLGHKAQSGKYSEVLVLENIYRPVGLRVFLYSKLLCPLIKDQEYRLRFHIKPLHLSEYQIGILFNDRELISRTDNPIGVSPSLQISEKDEIERDSVENWRTFELIYKAKGDEQFITFGNFNPAPVEGLTSSHRANMKGDVVCLIDHVSLVPVDTSDYPLCEWYSENKVLLYDTNERHTYNQGVNKVEKESPPAIEEEITEVPEGSREIKFEIPDIAFDFDEHSIRLDYLSTLDSLVQTIQQIGPQQISVIGHTDSRGSEDYNIILSEKRARTIKVFLLKHLSDYKNEIHAEGRGESQPRSSNATALGRAKNRRVEVILKVHE